MALETFGPPRKFRSRDPKLEENDTVISQRAADIIFLTFPPSQGRPFLQELFFREIAAFHPNWRMTDENSNRVESIVFRRAKKFLEHAAPKLDPLDFEEKNDTIVLHPYQKEKKIKTEVIDRVKDFQRAINGVRIDPGTHTLEIANSSIEQDYKYLVEEGGRPRSRPNSSIRNLDPWYSYTCLALTMNAEARKGMAPTRTGRSLHLAELDRIFMGFGDFLLHGGFGPLGVGRTRDAMFEEVRNIYDKKHPKDPTKW